MKYRSEHEEQCGLIELVRLYEGQIPELKMLFAIPNGGKRHVVAAVKLKKEGVKAGVSDLFLSVPSGDKHGLYIEMKSCDPKTKTSESQREWLGLARKYNYTAFICDGAAEAWDCILKYLGVDVKKA